MSPLVSILIPCFNAAHLAAYAIESALAQTGPETEVIVVDDGSTDGSLDVIRRYDGRIRWKTGPNLGSNRARNRLMELARGEWLQYLDADDYLRPGKIARQVELVREHPDCDVVYSPTGVELMVNGRLACTEEPIPEPHDPWIKLAHWQLPQTGGALWKKRALQSVGGWRNDQPCCQEHELYFRLLQAGARFRHCDGCLAVYRTWDHGPRISNKAPREVHRQRLLILAAAESHLAKRSELSSARRKAINDMRHITARTLWPKDRPWALQVAEAIRISDPNYYPWCQPGSPLLYSTAYRLLGFEAAQMLAACKRAVVNSAH